LEKQEEKGLEHGSSGNPSTAKKKGFFMESLGFFICKIKLSDCPKEE
jgi:hypothetical protein